VPELAGAGVSRVSVGGAFAFAALGALASAAGELRETGTYGFLAGSASGRAAVRRAFELIFRTVLVRPPSPCQPG
jgi:2-methylisocitrate lyase-like PEP mutase family enzyme